MAKPKYKYEFLIDVLSQKAASLPTGSRLPSIRSLMQRYGFTLQTINMALGELERKGQIERRRGSGIYTRKGTAMRHIELHWPLFSGGSGPDTKQVVVGNAVKAEGWSLGTRLHHIMLDDPSDTPDPAASAHIVTASLVSRDRFFFNLLMQQKVPVVVVGRQGDPAFDTVAASDHQVISPMVKHLISLGHDRVAYLCNEPDNFDTQRRRQIFAEVLSIFDLKPPTVIECGTKDGELGSLTSYRAMREFLAGLHGAPLPFTALVAASAPGARGAIRALHEAGFSVPGQCSVGALTIDPENALFIPSVSDAGTDHGGWGEAVVDILRRRFSGDRGGPILMELPTHLNVRESTGRAAA